MNFQWEKNEERLLRWMKISPKSKLEWLRQMNDFSSRCLPRKSRSIRLKVRRMRSLGGEA